MIYLEILDGFHKVKVSQPEDATLARLTTQTPTL